MTLTKEDFKNVRDGDWLHVEYPSAAQVSGTVGKSTYSLAIIVEECERVYVIDTRGNVHASRIIEHRPTKRVPKVGDVIESDEWDRCNWPQGWTVLASGFRRVLSINGTRPESSSGLALESTDWPVTVVQLPLGAGDPAPRVLTTVEEVDALPVGSIIVDAEGDAAQRKSPDTSGGAWLIAGHTYYYSSQNLPFPVTVVREGGAES